MYGEKMNNKIWPVLFLGILLLTACASGGESSTQITDEFSAPTERPNSASVTEAPGEISTGVITQPPPPEEQTSIPEMVSTPEESLPPPAGQGLPPALDLPPQSNAAEIRPPEQRKELTLLSNLLGFQIIDLYTGNS